MTIDLRKISTYLRRLSAWRRLGLIIGALSLAIVFIGAIVGFVHRRDTVSNIPEPSLIVDEVFQPTSTREPTLFPTLIPTPTPELRLTAYVVWTNQGPGIYLRDQPGGLAMDVIPNGTVLDEINQELYTSKGIDWVQVRFHDQTGWVARNLVYEMEGTIFLVDNSGAWLYQGIEGRVDTRLQPGTPYYLLEANHISTWLKIRLASGSEGWIRNP